MTSKRWVSGEVLVHSDLNALAAIADGALQSGSGSANYFATAGAASGSGPTLSAIGSSTNIPINITAKGNGFVVVTGGRLALGGVPSDTTWRRLSVGFSASALSGAGGSAAVVRGNLSGSATNALLGAALFTAVDSDSVNAASGFQSNYFGHAVTTGAIGGRTVHTSRLDIKANVNPGTMQYYTAGAWHTVASGGLGGVHFGSLGAVFGGNILAELRRAAGGLPGAGMNINQLVSSENNLASEYGTASFWTHGFQSVLLDNHVTAGIASDAAWVVASQPLTGGYHRTFVKFGAVNGIWAGGPGTQAITTGPTSLTTRPYRVADFISMPDLTIDRFAWRTATTSIGGQVTGGVQLLARDGVTAETAVVASIAVLDPGCYTAGATPTITIDAPPGSGTTATAAGTSYQATRIGRVNTGGGGFVGGELISDLGGTGTGAWMQVIKVNTASEATDMQLLKAAFAGEINDTVLTVSSVAFGALGVGDVIDGGTTINGTYITSLGTGTGGTGTYNVSRSQTVAAGTLVAPIGNVDGSGNYTTVSGSGSSTSVITTAAIVTGSISGTNLTVDAVTLGTLRANQTISGAGITAGTKIVSQTSGTTGGVGVYVVDTSQSASSTEITAKATAPTISLNFGFRTVGVTAAGSNYPEFPPPMARGTNSGRIRAPILAVTMTGTVAPLNLGIGYANHIRITGSAAAGGAVTATAVGADTNLDHIVQAKGTGRVYLKGRLKIESPGAGGVLMTIDDDGVTMINDVDSVDGFKTGGLRVVGERATGWGAPTGTATRTSFATSSVTLEQLAQRVKALVDDLTTHGLIGA